MEVINDKNMHEEIVNDLVEQYGWQEDRAKGWADVHGASIVSTMWDAYSHYMEEEEVAKTNE